MMDQMIVSLRKSQPNPRKTSSFVLASDWRHRGSQDGWPRDRTGCARSHSNRDITMLAIFILKWQRLEVAVVNLHELMENHTKHLMGVDIELLCRKSSYDQNRRSGDRMFWWLSVRIQTTAVKWSRTSKVHGLLFQIASSYTEGELWGRNHVLWREANDGQKVNYESW